VAAVLIVRLTSPSTFGGAPVASAPGELSASAPAPDISSMSPKERATRLYNRIMTAAESGDTAQMHFFVPMAVQSYALLGDLDADAHYHVGMIHLVNGEYAAASSQADSIARANPTNLLGAALKAELAKRRGDAPARKRAYRDLMANYDREMASGKGEYTDHREMLERMHTDAQKEGAK
jgi:DnaJ-domain-containing protein 1